MNKEIFELQAQICKTMANAKRLEIIYALRDGEVPVGELVERLGLTKANLSQHLAVLRQSRIVASRRDGVNVYYRISNPRIIEACSIMKSVLVEQLEESERLARRMK